jgi:membrane protein DedA with SNARE-associated domain
MADSLLEFIKTWGYFAVFLGSLIEGESIILSSCALSALGYLSLYKIMGVAFSGTLIADQLLYHFGRRYGESIFERFPRLGAHADRARRLLKRYDVLFILSFRFIYGIRVVSSVVIGVSGVSPKRFTILNTISAGVWTAVSCFGGYYAADTILKIFHYLAKFQLYLLGMGCVLLIIWIFFYLLRTKEKNPF